jgi:hypothetical protein
LAAGDQEHLLAQTAVLVEILGSSAQVQYVASVVKAD